MTYLIMQILFCLLIAFLLGLFIGWLLCKCCKKKCTKDKCCTHDHSVEYEDDEEDVTIAGAPLGFVSDYDDTATINLDTDVDLDTSIYNIETLEGIGPQTGDLFRGYGVATVGDYLRKLHKPSSREDAAKELNILVKPLHDWASMSDLLRVEGIDHQYAELTYAAGIKTVNDLANSDASQLTADMERVNSAGKQLIAPLTPTVAEVNDWIARANNMSPVVSV